VSEAPRMMPEVAPKPTVLCVEDEEPQLMLRKLLFEEAGFKVLAADSGKQALELFNSHQIAAVVMDYWMSPMNGTKLAEEMKKLNEKVPIVILSAWASLPGEILGIADIWLRKLEVEPEDLVGIVRSLIQKKTEKGS
jgi:CheY-like chemotaxis protein